MSLGEKIIKLRKKYNMTQEKIAHKIGISRQTLSNWEGDITSPDIKQAKELANIFKISLDDLLSNEIEMKCKEEKNILLDLIGKECYIDMESSDYRLNFSTLCRIVDVTNDFIKIEFKYKKDKIIKLIDKTLIESIKTVEKAGI